MQNDLTILYYTANRIGEEFARRVRAHLLEAAAGAPIVCVSQKPIEFGTINICVGEIGFSVYNCYRQISVAAKAASTRWVACCEDDSLYHAEHLAYRPPADEFGYNKSRWWIEPSGVFRWRDRSSMHACVCDRQLLVKTLAARFAAYPAPPAGNPKKLRSWGEPGRYEGNLGLPQVGLHYFRTAVPVVTFNHKGGLYGQRRINATDVIEPELPYWGRADELMQEFYGPAR